MNFEHRLEGGEELEKFLTTLPVKTERKFLVAGLRGPTKILKARVRREIKAKFTKRSGTLLRSVKHRTSKAKYGANIVIELSSIEGQTKFIRNKMKRAEKVKALKIKKEKGRFRDAYYARFLIKGTKTKSGAQRIKPTPFLDDALEGEKDIAIDTFNDSLITAIEKEAARMLLK